MNLTAGHTPGPWEVVPENRAESRWVIGDEEGGSIASCEPCGPWITHQEADANARLIAEAPALLAELNYVVTYFEGGIMPLDLHDWRMRANTAIARATGAKP